MAKRAHIVFYGDNGTSNGFFIKQKAIELGLKGICKHNSNKEIELDIEGKTNSVDEFIKFIEKGINLQGKTNSFTVEIEHELKGYTTMESDIV